MLESKFRNLLKNPLNVTLVISYATTIFGFIFDLFNYYESNNMILVALNGVTLPFLISGYITFIVNRKHFKISARILIISLVVNISITNILLFQQNAPSWEQYYLRDTILIGVFIIISGLLLSRYYCYLINTIFCVSVIIIWILSKDSFIKNNAVFLIIMMTAFTIGIEKFMTRLRKSLQKNEELLALIALQKEEILKKENELIAKKVTVLENTVEGKNKELVSKAMMFAKNKESNSLVIKKLLKIQRNVKSDDKKELGSIIKSLAHSEDNLHWKEFQLRFEHVHQSFYSNLKSKFPDLTHGELKLSAFIKLKLSSKEIALLTNITKSSVDVARSRLRKKLGIDTSENVVEFLDKF